MRKPNAIIDAALEEIDGRLQVLFALHPYDPDVDHMVATTQNLLHELRTGEQVETDVNEESLRRMLERVARDDEQEVDTAAVAFLGRRLRAAGEAEA